MKKYNITRWVRYVYLKVVRIDDSPEKVARGFAFGVIIGIFPTFGLGLIIAALMAGPLRINKAAAIIGTLVMNPWTSPLFWALSFLSGSLMMGYSLADTLGLYDRMKAEPGAWKPLLGDRLLVPYITGNITVTAGFAAASYFGALWSARAYMESKKRKRDRLQGR